MFSHGWNGGGDPSSSRARIARMTDDCEPTVTSRLGFGASGSRSRSTRMMPPRLLPSAINGRPSTWCRTSTFRTWSRIVWPARWYTRTSATPRIFLHQAVATVEQSVGGPDPDAPRRFDVDVLGGDDRAAAAPWIRRDIRLRSVACRHRLRRSCRGRGRPQHLLAELRAHGLAPGRGDDPVVGAASRLRLSRDPRTCSATPSARSLAPWT